MQGVELLGVGSVLLGTVLVGLVAHELTHAMALHVLGVPYEIEWFPVREQSSGIVGRVAGTWASVTPRQISAEVPVRGIQLSALAPLLLAVPFAAVLFGVVPDPTATNNTYVTVWTVAWLACSIPSPRDFSVFWHADIVLRNEAAQPDKR